MRKTLLALLALAAALLAAPAPAVRADAQADLAFGPGEKLTYHIYWTFVRAGTAELEIMAPDEVNGEPALHYQARARTTPFVDKFYKVRDRIDAWTDPGVTRSLGFDQDQHEGDYEKRSWLEFNWDMKLVARYSRGRLRKIIQIPDGTFDALTTLFFFRTQRLYKGFRFTCPVTDGNLWVMGRALVLGKEMVETPMGEIECWKVQPEIKHVGGVFKKSPDADMWVWISTDERRLPVKVKSKVVVGHFTLELAGVEHVTPRSVPPMPRELAE